MKRAKKFSPKSLHTLWNCIFCAGGGERFLAATVNCAQVHDGKE
jgi:hypothetical protein